MRQGRPSGRLGSRGSAGRSRSSTREGGRRPKDASTTRVFGNQLLEPVADRVQLAAGDEVGLVQHHEVARQQLADRASAEIRILDLRPDRLRVGHDDDAVEPIARQVAVLREVRRVGEAVASTSTCSTGWLSSSASASPTSPPHRQQTQPLVSRTE